MDGAEGEVFAVGRRRGEFARVRNASQRRIADEELLDTAQALTAAMVGS